MLGPLFQLTDGINLQEILQADHTAQHKVRFLKAKREILLAAAALIDEEIRNLERGKPEACVDLTLFRPEWKEGDRLTAVGREAAYAAFDRGMRQVEVARLFQISTPSAHRIQKIWEGDRHVR